MRLTKKRENGFCELNEEEETYSTEINKKGEIVMRLIKKNNGKGKYIPAHKIKRKQCVNKLGQLEDIEDELGIDLITLFKALEEGIYTIRSKGKKRYPYLTHNNAVGYVFDFKFEQEAEYILSDYGTTWSLTKEDVETTQKAIEYVNSWFK